MRSTGRDQTGIFQGWTHCFLQFEWRKKNAFSREPAEGARRCSVGRVPTFAASTFQENKRHRVRARCQFMPFTVQSLMYSRCATFASAEEITVSRKIKIFPRALFEFRLDNLFTFVYRKYVNLSCTKWPINESKKQFGKGRALIALVFLSERIASLLFDSTFARFPLILIQLFFIRLNVTMDITGLFILSRDYFEAYRRTLICEEKNKN